ncbi:MAG: hypothetical protein JKY09_08735 [Crocinitomicaceae bacterium]|nr:hypothetical protein [Crocinitomicaceae bacterium]
MKHIILILSMFLTVCGWSQNLSYQIKGRITNQDVGNNEGGVTISMVHNGTVIASTKTASNGKYTLNASGSKDGKYEIVYSKPGLVTKKISFDGSKLNEEDIPAGNEMPFPTLDLDLFAERENIDFSFLNTEYVASFFWNERKFALDFDRAASQKVKKKIDDLLLQAEKKKAEADAKYQAAIQAADAAFGKEEYEKALGKYEEALSYKPKEKYPGDKIVELDALIQAKKREELVNQQADQEYNNLIKAADNLRDQDKLVEAVAKYKKASTKKDEQYPKDQITELNKRIEQRKKEAESQAVYDAAIKAGDGFMQQNNLRAAKDKFVEASNLKPSESYPKEKLKEIEEKLKAEKELAEKKAKYEAAVAAADALFTAKDYQGAKAKYNEALTFDSSSSYAKGRIKLCDEKLLANKAEQEKLKKIAEFLKAGQASIDKKAYEDAKGKYREVLVLDPANGEAKQKLAFIDKKIDEANNLATQQKEFDELVKKGDNASTSGNYDEAIAKYSAAVALIPSTEINKKIADARIKKGQTDLAAAKEEQFNQLLSEGNNLMSSGKLNEAKAKFLQAGKLNATSPVPNKKISEIDGLLSAQKATSVRKAKYDAAINAANANFNTEKWEEAKAKYREALTFSDDNSYANGRISEIEDIQVKEGAEAKKQAEIAALLTEGNKFYNSRS